MILDSSAHLSLPFWSNSHVPAVCCLSFSPFLSQVVSLLAAKLLWPSELWWVVTTKLPTNPEYLVIKGRSFLLLAYLWLKIKLKQIHALLFKFKKQNEVFSIYVMTMMLIIPLAIIIIHLTSSCSDFRLGKPVSDYTFASYVDWQQQENMRPKLLYIFIIN